MRERILEVAEELFAAQGYGGTSLRHIADHLGVSKAAIYYHFHTKADIAGVVVGRGLDALAAIAERLVVAGTDVDAWRRAVPQIIDIAIAHRRLLSLLERDKATYQALFADDPAIGGRMREHEQRTSGLFADSDLDPGLRVRLGCAFGALLAPLFILSDQYLDLTADELREHLQSAIAALLVDPTRRDH